MVSALTLAAGLSIGLFRTVELPFRFGQIAAGESACGVEPRLLFGVVDADVGRVVAAERAAVGEPEPACHGEAGTDLFEARRVPKAEVATPARVLDRVAGVIGEHYRTRRIHGGSRHCPALPSG